MPFSFHSNPSGLRNVKKSRWAVLFLVNVGNDVLKLMTMSPHFNEKFLNDNLSPKVVDVRKTSFSLQKLVAL